MMTEKEKEEYRIAARGEIGVYFLLPLLAIMFLLNPILVPGILWIWFGWTVAWKSFLTLCALFFISLKVLRFCMKKTNEVIEEELEKEEKRRAEKGGVSQNKFKELLKERQAARRSLDESGGVG